MAVKVSLVEDDDELRASLMELLRSAEGLRCHGAYGTAEQAMQKIPLDPPDVLLMDINLPGRRGLECVAELKSRLPALKVLMLTRHEESDLIFSSLRAGASGCLLKRTSPEELIEAVEQAHAGGSGMSLSIARKLIEHFEGIQQPRYSAEQLAQNEKQLLKLVARGNSCADIAASLGIKEVAVRTQLHGIYQKLHSHGKFQHVGGKAVPGKEAANEQV